MRRKTNMENRNFISAVENARIIFRNFSGEERMYNKKGDRNFTLVLTPEKAEELRNLGYNVKTRPPREEGDENQYLLAVSVSYKIRPPKIVLINGRLKIDLDRLFIMSRLGAFMITSRTNVGGNVRLSTSVS